MQILKQGKTPENYDLQAEEWQYSDGSKSYIISTYPKTKRGNEARLFAYVPNKKTALTIFDEFAAGTMTFSEPPEIEEGRLATIVRRTARGK